MKKAYKIASRCLRECYNKHGIVAGRTHFSDIWARDSFFASFGACKLRDFLIVKKNLSLFLRYQAKDGQIPLRIGTYNLIPKLLGFKESQETRARYVIDTIFPSNLRATDCNSLFVIASANYIKESKDKAFARKNYKKIKKAIEYNLTIADNDLLLIDKGLTTWDDRIFKRGKVLYTNVLHFKALEDFAFLAKLNKDKDSSRFITLAKKVKARINKLFWNNNFYSDWIENGKAQEYFSSSGNALAALWIADKEKIKKIDTTIKKLGVDKYFALKPVSPPYLLSKIYFPITLLGIPDYQTKMLWPWISCLYVIAIYKTEKQRARKLLTKLTSKINEYNNCYEVYEQNGQPVRRIFYKSERPFAWFAGLFIYACSLLKK